MAQKKKKINSKKKGGKGERLWRDELRKRGYDAIRGRQYSGGTDSPDVKCAPLSDLHFEVKNVEALRIHAAVEQAIGDAGAKVPVVAYKKNHKDWLVIMQASDWLDMVEKLYPEKGVGVVFES